MKKKNDFLEQIPFKYTKMTFYIWNDSSFVNKNEFSNLKQIFGDYYHWIHIYWILEIVVVLKKDKRIEIIAVSASGQSITMNLLAWQDIYILFRKAFIVIISFINDVQQIAIGFTFFWRSSVCTMYCLTVVL